MTYVLEIVPVEGFNRIMAIDSFDDELSKLFKKSTPELKKYLIFLHKQLHKIDNRTTIINREEPISYKGINLYAIRKRMKKNTRVLYFYMQNEKIVLLTAFDEKNSSDYDNGKERAYNRLKQLKII